MARPKKKTNKKYIFDNFYIDIDIYKRKVVTFQLRFDFKRDSKEEIDGSELKGKLNDMFENEFSYIKRSRHIFETDFPLTISQTTGCCSFNCYFMIIDDYEEYILKHAQNLMKNVETLLNQKDFQTILPTRKNNYTKTY